MMAYVLCDTRVWFEYGAVAAVVLPYLEVIMLNYEIVGDKGDEFKGWTKETAICSWFGFIYEDEIVATLYELNEDGMVRKADIDGEIWWSITEKGIKYVR